MSGRCRCCCRWACRHREKCCWRWPLDCPCRVVPAIWVNLWGLLAFDYKTGVLALVPEHWTSHALARAHEAAFCILRDDDDAHDAVQDARVNLRQMLCCCTSCAHGHLLACVRREAWRKRRARARRRYDTLDKVSHEPASARLGPDRQAERAEVRVMMDLTICTWDPTTRDMWTRWFDRSQRYRDIAGAHRVPEREVRRRLCFARCSLYEALQCTVGRDHCVCEGCRPIDGHCGCCRCRCCRHACCIHHGHSGCRRFGAEAHTRLPI